MDFKNNSNSDAKLSYNSPISVVFVLFCFSSAEICGWFAYLKSLCPPGDLNEALGHFSLCSPSGVNNNLPHLWGFKDGKKICLPKVVKGNFINS